MSILHTIAPAKAIDFVQCGAWCQDMQFANRVEAQKIVVTTHQAAYVGSQRSTEQNICVE